MKKISLSTWISGSIVLLFFLIALLAPWLANDSLNPHSVLPIIKFGPETADILTAQPLAAPDSIHIFGTDHIGRDLFSRLVHAIRNSFFFSLIVMAISMISGMIIGGLMGFFGGAVDLIFSRIMELIGNFPIFLLQLTMVAFLPQSYTVLLFVMVVVAWIPYARFTRAEFFRLRRLEFVQASQAIGSSKWRIFFKHLLPNSLTPIFTYAPFDLSGTITVLGALSFLGFGEPINVASIGELLAQAKEHFREAWWLAVYPGGTLFLLTLSLALFGSALRDIFDPRAS